VESLPDRPIILQQISKAFRVDGRIVGALENVSLDAQARQFVTLIGPSGCGKSTLLNIVCGLLEPDEGVIRIHGQEGAPRLGRVGYMPQRDLLLPWKRVMDNILLGPQVMGRDLAEARREALALLPLFGLEGFEHHYPATLSGGMRQRAALMRTFMGHHDLVLLDEPFGALDALTRRAMRRWLLEIWLRFRQTILFVTHDVEEAVYLSDRVVVLSPRPGRVILTLDLDLPEDRHARHAASPEFIAYRLRILAALGLED
jgi:ABC-type nitrate/sulfonate/bicarbonate transport system ATPase subunit